MSVPLDVFSVGIRLLDVHSIGIPLLDVHSIGIPLVDAHSLRISLPDVLSLGIPFLDVHGLLGVRQRDVHQLDVRPLGVKRPVGMCSAGKSRP